MTEAISADVLRQLSTPELQQVFATLQAPEIAELDGEYAASLLTQPHWLVGAAGRLFLENPLHNWLAKGFRPVNDHKGQGYNCFRQLGRVERRYPMWTELAPSRFDGLPAYQLRYRPFLSLCGAVHMVDEVRRVAPGLYLGLGTWGFTDAQRRIPYPFLLEGPVAPYRCDIGRLRPGP